ncbi:MAG: FAD-binding oxidoreductase, partial [Myxococcales bacterium]|nr:FAD-binding oxidoreductase [Myxococcales bacterium]
RALRLSTERLRSLVVHPRSARDRARGVQRVTAGAATTFGELWRAVPPFVPFCAPSESRCITLGGALASNVYSRASARGGLLAEHVTGFSLATPAGRVLRCAPDENAPLFAAVPGGLGALGVADEITLELRDTSTIRAVGSEVLARTRSADELASSLAEGLDDTEWHLGRYALVHGDASRAGATVLRSRYLGALAGFEDCGPMPGHGRSVAESAAHVVAHLWPAVCDTAARAALRPGLRFVDRLEDFTFFQDAYVTSRRALARSRAARALVGVTGRSPSLPLAQQAFVVPDGALPRFLYAVGSTLRRFAGVAKRVVLQDVLRLPASAALMAPAWPSAGAWIYTLSIPINIAQRARVEAALRAVARVAWHSARARVHLLKAVFCDDELLREMWRPQLEQLAALRREHDPAALIDSALLGRLLPRGPQRHTSTVMSRRRG